MERTNKQKSKYRHAFLKKVPIGKSSVGKMYDHIGMQYVVTIRLKMRRKDAPLSQLREKTIFLLLRI